MSSTEQTAQFDGQTWNKQSDKTIFVSLIGYFTSDHRALFKVRQCVKYNYPQKLVKVYIQSNLTLVWGRTKCIKSSAWPRSTKGHSYNEVKRVKSHARPGLIDCTCSATFLQIFLWIGILETSMKTSLKPEIFFFKANLIVEKVAD